MRTVRNITVCVSPELYRQTKLLAAKYDTTVTGVVAFVLERLPDALARARYPVGGTKRKTSASTPTVSPARMQSPKPPEAPEGIAAKALRVTASSATGDSSAP